MEPLVSSTTEVGTGLISVVVSFAAKRIMPGEAVDTFGAGGGQRM